MHVTRLASGFRVRGKTMRSAGWRRRGLRLALVLAGMASALAVDALAAASKIPLPRPRPATRGAASKTGDAAPKPAAQNAAPGAAGAPKAILPATRQHAALPPAPQRKPAVPAAVAATTSTSQADTEALENVIALVRNHKPADATQAATSITDPVAAKLAEWIILRSDDNGASVERYRAFVSANPSWPSQSFMRRRAEAALWDDHRDDQTVLAWFNNEAPLS